MPTPFLVVLLSIMLPERQLLQQVQRHRQPTIRPILLQLLHFHHTLRPILLQLWLQMLIFWHRQLLIKPTQPEQMQLVPLIKFSTIEVVPLRPTHISSTILIKVHYMWTRLMLLLMQDLSNQRIKFHKYLNSSRHNNYNRRFL